MEHNPEATRQPKPEDSGTDIHSILGELIQKDTGLVSEKNSPSAKNPAENKTPLANLKTMLSTVDAVAQEDKGVSKTEKPPVFRTTGISKEKTPTSSRLAESDAVRTLDELIQAHRSRKKQ